MTPQELRELSDVELEGKLGELKEELFRLRFANVTGQLDNPQRLKRVRHDIARVLTIQSERRHEASADAAQTHAVQHRR
jgi:large subunit ribosomal protein L29